jgi:NAD(P)-dependent dehydrogenase (short-subunit alcohol dehydrogenase family)
MTIESLLTGHVVFISGGGSGVNLGIARRFAVAGANIAICGRSAERLEAAAGELRALGAEVVTAPADVRDLSGVEQAFATTEAALGPVDTVVAGAAGNFLAPAEQLTSNGFRAVVDIDLLGSFHCARAAFDQLRRTRGSLLFVSADQARSPYEEQAHVGAAKAGVDALMRNLALEWGKYGIRANALAPGPVEGTEGMRRLTELTGRDIWTDMVPLSRFARPEEIGDLAVVLSSPLAGYVTGAVLPVDGGLRLCGPYPFNARLRSARAQR